jgi:hypothetical protein
MNTQINMKMNLYKSMFLFFILFIMNCYPAFGSTSSTQNNFTSNSTVYISDISDIMNDITENMLAEHIQEIEKIGPHPTGSDELISVKNYIVDELNTKGLTIRLEDWALEGKSGINIEATLKGQGKSESIVIVSAHYDSVDISPGADDDGSGVSVVLSLAKIMSKYIFNSSIRFVFFSGEEQGRLGSICYARNAYNRGDKIIADLQLDGVGYAVSDDGGRYIRHHSNEQSKWMTDYSKKTADVFSDIVGLEVLVLPHVDFSDHESFVEMGYDASYFFRYEDNPYYHTSEDRLKYMNMTYLKKFCRLTLGTIAFIAELNPVVLEDDLKITVKGAIFAPPCQFYIKIENENLSDTANLTIQIKLKNIFTDECISIVKGAYGAVCNWSFNEEIVDYWEFKTMNRRYKNGFFNLEIVLKGFNDDSHIYVKKQTIGLAVFGYKVFLIPKL